jgi:hypothetical protein
VKKYGVGGIFNKQLLTGNIEERVEEILNGVFLSLDKNVVKRSKGVVFKKYLTEKREGNSPRLSQVEVKVSGKLKTCLKDIWKVFCLDMKTKQKRYFLINDYQRE